MQSRVYYNMHTDTRPRTCVSVNAVLPGLSLEIFSGSYRKIKSCSSSNSNNAVYCHHFTFRDFILL